MKSLFYYIGLLLLLCSNLARSQEKIRFENQTHSSAISNARHYVDSLRNELEIPGLSVAVSINNKIVWSEGFGYANVADRSPVTRSTKFRIGSISKSLTSIAMAKLIETGRLDLNEFVQTYLPDFPEKEYKFTVKQLASHQSGIPHYRLADFLINKRFNSVNESLEVFKKRKLKFEPGTDFQYSTFGYVLLSAVIEKAAGVPYLEYMDKEIFSPLGIQHTAPDDLAKSIVDKSHFYKTGKPKEIKERDLSYKWAGGGYLSTADDLVHIIDRMGEILSDQMIDQLWTPIPLKNGKMNPQSYALGWRRYTDQSGLEIIHHGGVSAGARAFVMTLPKEKITVAMLANAAVRYNLQEAYDIAKYFKN